MKFKDLSVGQTFDFVGGKYPSFFLACRKVSALRYEDSTGTIHAIGSTSADVYHVGRKF